MLPEEFWRHENLDRMLKCHIWRTGKVDRDTFCRDLDELNKAVMAEDIAGVEKHLKWLESLIRSGQFAAALPPVRLRLQKVGPLELYVPVDLDGCIYAIK